MFNAMMEAFMEEVVGFVFHLEVEVEPTPRRSAWSPAPTGSARPDRRRTAGSGDTTVSTAHLVESGPDPDGPGVGARGRRRADVEDEAGRGRGDRAAEPCRPAPQVRAKGLAASAAAAAQLLRAGRGRRRSKTAASRGRPTTRTPGVGRNAPCPCGSGKKFKMCHGRPGPASLGSALTAGLRGARMTHSSGSARTPSPRSRPGVRRWSAAGSAVGGRRGRARRPTAAAPDARAGAPGRARRRRPAPSPSADPEADRPAHRRQASDNGPVIAVKVENIAAPGRRSGCDPADIVFVEEVEGAQTRLIAVYHTTLPAPARPGPQRPQHRRPAAAAVRQARPGLLAARTPGPAQDRQGLASCRSSARPATTGGSRRTTSSSTSPRSPPQTRVGKAARHRLDLRRPARAGGAPKADQGRPAKVGNDTFTLRLRQAAATPSGGNGQTYADGDTGDADQGRQRGGHAVHNHPDGNRDVLGAPRCSPTPWAAARSPSIATAAGSPGRWKRTGTGDPLTSPTRRRADRPAPRPDLGDPAGLSEGDTPGQVLSVAPRRPQMRRRGRPRPGASARVRDPTTRSPDDRPARARPDHPGAAAGGEPPAVPDLAVRRTIRGGAGARGGGGGVGRSRRPSPKRIPGHPGRSGPRPVDREARPRAAARGGVGAPRSPSPWSRRSSPAGRWPS